MLGGSLVQYFAIGAKKRFMQMLVLGTIFYTSEPPMGGLFL